MPKSKSYKLVAEPADLPPEADQAHRFEKARTAQATALLEDYAELISDLIGTEGEAPTLPGGSASRMRPPSRASRA